ncbi:MAG TPA: fibronectin-binding protein [Mycobacterium sp.]
MLTRSLIAAVSAVGAAVLLAVPAGADPGGNPCKFSMNFVCRFVPIAPELEGDVDLTQQQPPGAPAVLAPESLPPADPCASGCI